MNSSWPPDWLFQVRYRDEIKPYERLLPGDHPIESEEFPPEVNWIMDRLRSNGYSAYLVGGTVRDLLLEREPKDYDISTDATPYEILRMFANSKIIGRRFLLVHIFFRDGNFIEVSTFRALRRGGKVHHSPRRRDNQFGTLIEDVWRRDLTVNALLYDSETGEVLDYVGGLEDLRGKVIRTVGPPGVRFREDPVRMFRAIRHSSRLGFFIEEKTWKAIRQCAQDIKLCSPARVFEEFMRELRGGYSGNSLRLMYSSGLFLALFPDYYRWIKELGERRELFWRHFFALDERIQSGEEFSDLFLFSWFLLPYLRDKVSLDNLERAVRRRGHKVERILKDLRLPHLFRVEVISFLEKVALLFKKKRGKRGAGIRGAEVFQFYSYLLSSG